MATNFVGRSLVANISEQNITLNMSFINVIVNDSVNTITIAFDEVTTGTNVMIIKTGESRENVAIPFKKLYFKANVDTSAFRIEGIVKES